MSPPAKTRVPCNGVVAHRTGTTTDLSTPVLLLPFPLRNWRTPVPVGSFLGSSREETQALICPGDSTRTG